MMLSGWEQARPTLLILRSIAERCVSKDAVWARPRGGAMVPDAPPPFPSPLAGKGREGALLTMRKKCVGQQTRPVLLSVHGCAGTYNRGYLFLNCIFNLNKVESHAFLDPSFQICGNLLQHRLPGLLLLLHEGGRLGGRHGARVAAELGKLALDVRIVDHLGEVIAHLADDGIGRTVRRRQNL